MIIGEQDEALEVVGAGPGVMRQPGQAEIGPQPVEKRQRDRVVIVFEHDAIGQLVADIGQFGRGEMPRDQVGIDACQLGPGAPVEDIGEGDLLFRGTETTLHIVILADQFELLAQIVAKQLRAGDRGGVQPGRIETAERAVAVGRLVASAKAQPQFGIGIAAVVAPFGRGKLAFAAEGDHVLAEPLHGSVVDFLEPVERLFDGFHGRCSCLLLF